MTQEPLPDIPGQAFGWFVALLFLAQAGVITGAILTLALREVGK